MSVSVKTQGKQQRRHMASQGKPCAMNSGVTASAFIPSSCLPKFYKYVASLWVNSPEISARKPPAKAGKSAKSVESKPVSDLTGTAAAAKASCVQQSAHLNQSATSSSQSQANKGKGISKAKRPGRNQRRAAAKKRAALNPPNPKSEDKFAEAHEYYRLAKSAKAPLVKAQAYLKGDIATAAALELPTEEVRKSTDAALTEQSTVRRIGVASIIAKGKLNEAQEAEKRLSIIGKIEELRVTAEDIEAKAEYESKHLKMRDRALQPKFQVKAAELTAQHEFIRAGVAQAKATLENSGTAAAGESQPITSPTVETATKPVPQANTALTVTHTKAVTSSSTFVADSSVSTCSFSYVPKADVVTEETEAARLMRKLHEIRNKIVEAERDVKLYDKYEPHAKRGMSKSTYERAKTERTQVLTNARAREQDLLARLARSG